MTHWLGPAGLQSCRAAEEAEKVGKADMYREKRGLSQLFPQPHVYVPAHAIHDHAVDDAIPRFQQRITRGKT